MKKKKIIAIMAVLVILMGIFAACSGDKTKETDADATSVSTVTNAEGETVTDEDGKAVTTVVATDDKTSSIKASDADKASDKASSSTTTKKASNTASSSATTKKTTTANKTNNTTKKTTTTKKVTTTKATTQNLNKPLTASQKQWVIDNWFGKFPQYGAASGFRIVEMSSTNGLTSYINVNQGNYKSESQIGGIINDSDYMKYLANGCTVVRYYWKDTSTESVLYYKCVTN